MNAVPRHNAFIMCQFTLPGQFKKLKLRTHFNLQNSFFNGIKYSPQTLFLIFLYLYNFRHLNHRLFDLTEVIV